jgi:hypothetical protein
MRLVLVKQEQSCMQAWPLADATHATNNISLPRREVSGARGGLRS